MLNLISHYLTQRELFISPLPTRHNYFLYTVNFKTLSKVESKRSLEDAFGLLPSFT
jgi:hypothetical protein